MATYGSTVGVQALVPSLNIGAATVPTTAQVLVWLGEGYARINRALSTVGYTYPVDIAAGAYGELTALNDLYAAAYCLRARGIETATGTEEGRDVQWLKEFNERLAELVSADLTLYGVSLVATGAKRRTRIRTMQLRKVDGYSGAYETEYTAYNYPSE